MARRSGLGAFVKTVVKISREIDRANRRAEREVERAKRDSERELRDSQRRRNLEAKELAREHREAVRESAQQLRAQMRADAKATREAKTAQKERAKAAKQAEREREDYLDRISEELHPMTEVEFGLGKMIPRPRRKTVTDSWSLRPEFSYLKTLKRPFFGKLGFLKVDSILFSGAFNSVVGVDGLLAFKKAIEELKISYDDKISNKDIQAFLDDMFVALVQTGTYIVPKSNVGCGQDGWITAFRYILTNENSINSSEIRSEILDGLNALEIPPEAKDLFSKEDVLKLRSNLEQFAQETISLIETHLTETNARRLTARGA